MALLPIRLPSVPEPVAITVSIGEAARRIGQSRQKVRRLILAGDLIAEWTRTPEQYTRDRQGRLMRGHRRITEASLDAYVAAHPPRKNLEKVPR
jgi:hypothetical protein